jgi:GNAT superfamily N-acetyltransferase
MKILGDFTEDSHCDPLPLDGNTYSATWEVDGGFVELPGLTEYRVLVTEASGDTVAAMRWLVADIELAGGKEAMLDALESHSPDGADWADCLRRNCETCPTYIVEGGAVALLKLIAAAPAFQGQGIGTRLAKAFGDAVLAPRGVRAIWIKPMPLKQHAVSGFFKPEHDSDTPAYLTAKDRLEKHYQRSLDADWTCPDYLRADLTPP